MVGTLFDLKDKVALITGGGSGLGLAMAHGLADHGAHVVLVGRNAENLNAGVAAIIANGGAASSCVCDLLDGSALNTMVAEVEQRHGRVDILLNNAGCQHRQSIVDVSDKDWHRVIDTNLTAPFQVVRAVAPGMISRKSGKIINTLSVLSTLGRASVVPYTSAKGGLQMLTRGLAVELASANVQVNGIAPGYILTDMNKALAADPEFDGWLRKRTPAGRWGQPADLVGAVVFLASGASNFVTGQVVTVDGGMTAAV